MTAAMNGSINFSTNDGWILEYAKHKHNSFIVPEVDLSLPVSEQDKIDATHLLDILQNDILPMYYKKPAEWTKIVKNSMNEVVPYFDSGRMADEYYQQLYKAKVQEREALPA